MVNSPLTCNNFCPNVLALKRYVIFVRLCRHQLRVLLELAAKELVGWAFMKQMGCCASHKTAGQHTVQAQAIMRKRGPWLARTRCQLPALENARTQQDS